MRRPTELMESILTSPEAQKIIDYVSPIYGESYVCLWLMQVIGAALDRSRRYVDEFFYQVTPGTATWTIEYWEKEYGITPDPSWTLAQRQENIVYRIRYRAPMNPRKLEQYVSAASGVTCKIEENIAKNKFRLKVTEQTKDMTRIRSALEEAKPAHIIYEIVISLLEQAAMQIFVAAASTMRMHFEINALPLYEAESDIYAAFGANSYLKYEIEVQ